MCRGFILTEVPALLPVFERLAGPEPPKVSKCDRVCMREEIFAVCSEKLHVFSFSR